MKVLGILFAAFALALMGTRMVAGEFNYVLAGNIAMSVMLLITTWGHFAYVKGMEMMMPDFIPFKKELVYLTGVIELAAAIVLLIPSLRVTTGWLLILFFVMILPANIHAAVKGVDFQKATITGNNAKYLWFRIPMQIFLIGWVYAFAIWL